MSPAALLDACVLVPIRLCSILLSVAERGAFQPLWSEVILEETERTLRTRLGLDEQAAARRIGHMVGAFPEANVAGSEHMTQMMTCHPKDRHVAAAAVDGGADVLVTANLKDFPTDSLAPYGVTVQHPDLFLVDLWSADQGQVADVVIAEAARYRNPELSAHDLLAGLATVAPNFANLVAEHIEDENRPVGDDPWLVTAEMSELEAGVFSGTAPNLSQPAQVGLLWWQALSEADKHRDVLDHLTYHPPAWDGYRFAINAAKGRSFATGVRAAVDAPDWIAYMKLVPEVAATSRVFANSMTSALILTLVKIDDGTWRVWGLGPHRPSAAQVRGDDGG